MPSRVLDEFDKRDMIIHRKGCLPNGTRRERLTRGTHIPSSPILILELNYPLILGAHRSVDADDNVIPIQA